MINFFYRLSHFSHFTTHFMPVYHKPAQNIPDIWREDRYLIILHPEIV